MFKNCLLIALLLSTGNALAEISSCNVGGEAKFNVIELNTEANTVLITDRSEHKVDGKITLVREHSKGLNRFNVAFEYKLNGTPVHFEMIIVPVEGEAYRVGVAGYVKKGKNDVLEVTSNDEALCY